MSGCKNYQTKNHDDVSCELPAVYVNDCLKSKDLLRSSRDFHRTEFFFSFQNPNRITHIVLYRHGCNNSPFSSDTVRSRVTAPCTLLLLRTLVYDLIPGDSREFRSRESERENGLQHKTDALLIIKQLMQFRDALDAW